ncbi:hypothetical protein [Streptomyces rhizosphaericus]|uniref:Secreted protein n=1 Tax=Streptomyces rhizosphaericus TaxID=114699 RepID=A0A6G4ARF8_9ACTN|nr:hypothetical protein [Streptomyces rhizosphaericus]NEW75364.1 hypothetical protein [Streptomyces rhizosphaericus]
MSSVLANILIGLITSLISGLSVWLWQRAKYVRAGRRQAAFFGISPGQSGLIILTHHHSSPWVTSHYDVYALLEAAALVDQVRGEIAVEAASEFRGSNGNRTELCIGGPDANERSAGHLAYHLPGIRFLPFSSGPDALGIVVGDREFLWVRGEREYAVVAKFTLPGARSPVFLICGQTGNTNHAAVHFLRHHYQELMKTLPSIDRFCLIVRVSLPNVYGHELVELERDVTAEAFAS